MPPTAQLKRSLSRGLTHARAVEQALPAVPLTEVDFAAPDPSVLVSFRCNVCGRPSVARFDQLNREIASCKGCHSTVRFRAIVELLITALFGEDLRLDEIPVRKDIAGLGLSDTGVYAEAFAGKFNYTNTYFHLDPKLDIANVPHSMAGKYDFVISSDVFEHVVPPVSKAFINTRRLLKPGGVCIFTVPFGLQDTTVEHFPELYDFKIAQQRGRWVLNNRTADGRHQTFTDLVFHGGPGSTLEMRVFARDSLLREFTKAGFKSVRIAEDPCPDHGIYWPEQFSLPIVARL